MKLMGFIAKSSWIEIVKFFLLHKNSQIIIKTTIIARKIIRMTRSVLKITQIANLVGRPGIEPGTSTV